VTFREQPAPDRSQFSLTRPTPSSEASFESASGAHPRMGRRRASTVTFVDRPAPSPAGNSRPPLPSAADSDSYLKAPPSLGRRRASSSATLFPDEPYGDKLKSFENAKVKSLDDDELGEDDDKLGKSLDDDKLRKSVDEEKTEAGPSVYVPARLGRRRASSMTLVAPAPLRPAKYKLRRPSSLTLAPSTTGMEDAVDLLPAFTRGDTSDPPRGPKLSARLRAFCKWPGALDWTADGGRLRYLDSLKLIAAITLLTATVFTSATREWAGASTVLYPVRSDFALSVFMVLVGRILPLPWLEPLASGKAAAPTIPASMRQFGQALLRRPFRFLPVLLISGLQYAVGRAGGPFATSEPLRQLFGGVAELPQWTLSNARAWAGVATSLFVASDMSVHLRSTSSTLYTTPWLLQGSLYILGVATFSGLFKNSSRQALFVFLAVVNWCTYSFLTPFMLGLIIADLSVCGTLTRLSAGGTSNRALRTGLQCAVAALLAVFLFVAPLREGLSNALAHAQVLHGTEGDPLTSGHQLLRFSDVISAALMVLLAEVAWPVRAVLSFRPLAALGRFGAAAVAISHPLVLFYLVPRLYQPSFDAVDHSAGSVLLRLWGLTLGLSLAAAPLIAMLAELPSEVMARLCVRFFLPNLSATPESPPPPPPEAPQKASPAVTLVAPPTPMVLVKDSLPDSPLRKNSFTSTPYSSDSPRKDSMAPTLYDYSPRKDSFAPSLYGKDSPRRDSMAPTLYKYSPRKDSFAPSLYGKDSPRRDSFAPTLYGTDSPRKDSFTPSLYGKDSPRRDSFAPTLYGTDSPRKDCFAPTLYTPDSPYRRDSLAPTLCEPASPYRKDSFTPSLLAPPSPLRRDSLAPTLFPPPSPMRRDSLALPLHPPPSPLRRVSVALPSVQPPSPLGPGNDGPGSPK
jgi:hypothetical protein